MLNKKKLVFHCRAALKLQEQISSNMENKVLDEERKIKEGELLLKKMQQDHQRDYQEMKKQQLKKQVFRVLDLIPTKTDGFTCFNQPYVSTNNILTF